MRHITSDLRNEAIRLRKLGLSYSEIRRHVPVAKSTLSILLRNIILDEKAKKIIESKSVKAQILGARAKKDQRIRKEEQIKNSAVSQIANITNKELFLMGIMLYWAEGSKIREGNISQGLAFTNSDPVMIRLFLKWLQVSLGIKSSEITLAVYIHESSRGNEKEILSYWIKETGFKNKSFRKISFTKTKLSKENQRKNRHSYYGQLRIVVNKSTDLNRRIAGWIEGVCVKSGVVK